MAVENIITEEHEALRNSTWQYLLSNGLSVRKLSQKMGLPYYSLYRFLQGKTHKYPRKSTLHALEELIKGGQKDYTPAQEYADNKTLIDDRSCDTETVLKVFGAISEVVRKKGLRFQDSRQAWRLVEIICDFHTQARRKGDIDYDFIEFILRRNAF